MTKFAEHQERGDGPAPGGADGSRAARDLRAGRADVAVRPLRQEDVRACAQLAADREGEGLQRWVDAFERALQDDSQLVLVAEESDEIRGYGKAGHLDPASKAARGMPAGWYLTGMVVHPDHRRRGIGRRLTVARLEELAERGVDEVWYFAAAVNTVSLDLHTDLGFVEVTRDFHAPWVTFTGGEGVLSVWSRPGA